MADDAGMIPSMTVLNNDCLRRILLFVPVADRIKLRSVCKRFCEISDDCWHEMRRLNLLGPRMNAVPEPVINRATMKIQNNTIEIENGLSGIHDVIVLKTSNQRLIEGAMKRCGEFIITLGDHREDRAESILPPAIKYCRKLESLSIAVTSKAEDKQLNHLLALNQKLRVLNLDITFKNIKVCFRTIPAEFLEVLGIEACGIKPPPSVLMSQKQILRKSHLLRKLRFHTLDDELVRLIGEKTQLEVLTLETRNADYLTENGLTPILQLRNLRELNISAPISRGSVHVETGRVPVDDDFLKTLSENLQMLESFFLGGPASVTDEGFSKLASLPKLRILIIKSCKKITDKFLILFDKIQSLCLMKCNIRDEGVIKFLEKSQTIHHLSLEHSHITNKSLVAAIQATQQRDNGLLLYFLITGTKTEPEKLIGISPLLKILDRKKNKMFVSKSY